MRLSTSRPNYQNLVLPEQEIYLRIPGAAEYWRELDVRVSSVLVGETKPKAALDDIYQAWEQITNVTAGRVRKDSMRSRMFRSFDGACPSGFVGTN
jgi:multiple sugar transport system substrate-binding protein